MKETKKIQEVKGGGGGGGGGGGEGDGALANPTTCRTIFCGKRELFFLVGQKQEILSRQD